MKKIFFLLVFLINSIPSWAQIDTTQQKTIFQTSAEDLLNQNVKKKDVEISLATKTALSPEEAPSIVSVITKEDIEHYGFRDISDALRTIPGFEFGIDLTGLVGLGFRGIWVHEGKYQIMINGQPLNDLGYGNYNFIGTIPLGMVERIEIIRGSGSVLYGAFAEIAAINIVMQSGENLKGMQFQSGMGTMGKNGLTRYAGISGGTRFRDLEVSFHTGVNARPLSTKPYQDFFGNTLQQNQENSDRKYHYLIAQLKYKHFKFAYNLSNFDFFGNDGVDRIISSKRRDSLQSLNHKIQNISFEYAPNFSRIVQMTLLAEVTQSNTATTGKLTNNIVTGAYNYIGGVNIQRYRGDWNFNFDLKAGGNLTVGNAYTLDAINNADARGFPGLQASNNPADTVYSKQTYSWALFSQYVAKIGRFGISGGLRFENTTFGNASSYRIGVTYFHKKLNAKLLAGKSFRVPLGWQVYSRDLTINTDLRPEIAMSYEAELGYKLTRELSWRANAFFIHIDKVITYTGISNAYINAGIVESLGFETEMNWKSPKFGAYLNLSYARPGSQTLAQFRSADDFILLGLPSTKANLGGYVKWKKLSFSPSFTYLGKKQGQSKAYANGETNDVLENEEYPAIILTNLNIAWQGIFKKLDLNFSVYNLLDTQYLLVQPYYGSHAPLPVNNRQITLGMKYRF